MFTTIDRQAAKVTGAGEGVTAASARDEATASRLTSDRVWRELAKTSFAVISYATSTGKPRSAGVVYATVGRRLYVVTGVDTWKARHITASGQVAVTVPVRRGGIMSLLLPIPPATVSFHASAVVHPADSLDGFSLPKRMTSVLPPERRTTICVIEIRPEGRFVTYGLGIPLWQMRTPALARACVPVD